MMTAEQFRRLVLGLEGAREGAHMGHPDFRVNNRIFASLHHGDRFGMVVLTPADQQQFLREHASIFEPESGAWGRQGCTRVLLESAEEEAVGEAVTLAWRHISAKTAAARPKKAPSATKTRTFAQVVKPYPSAVADLARGARALLFEVLPGVEETGDTRGPYLSYGYGPGYKGIVAYITVSQKGVKLGLAGGSSLPDPKKLLQGAGKSNRHVVITSPADLRTTGLRPLIRASLAAWKKRTA
jgi:hypothetical protein